MSLSHQFSHFRGCLSIPPSDDTLITSLERARVSPKTAQTLARHSDIRLTLGTYTHIELHAQTAAIESLPAPPGGEAA